MFTCSSVYVCVCVCVAVWLLCVNCIDEVLLEGLCARLVLHVHITVNYHSDKRKLTTILNSHLNFLLYHK